ncbi:SMP-30/gluconolactonase/LRE family protein [Nonomuraea sp. JJY05]|uniref:SMP-30/gluconolactonase/LRE family protein n=1 Tax=Nonomuraea sp. JJY05 TaxID=3350255 RepID=UPI00373EC308
MIITATPASGEVYALGEGPVWDPVRERLLWVDIVAGRVHEGMLDEGKVTATVRHAVDTTVGAVAVSADGDLIVAGQAALIRLGADGSRVELARCCPPTYPADSTTVGWIRPDASWSAAWLRTTATAGKCSPAWTRPA